MFNGYYEWRLEGPGQKRPFEVTLHVKIDTCRVEVTFVNDPGLVYRAHEETWVPGNELCPHPIEWTENHDHCEVWVRSEEGSLDIVLGSGTNYTIIVEGDDADANVIAGANAHIGNVAIYVSGNIDFQMTGATSIADSITIALETGVSVDVDVTLPPGIGGSFDFGYRMFSYTEGINVTTRGTWSTDRPYVTSDYDTSDTTVTIAVACECGDIVADLA
jgi:hypothetical protein